ncbi:MAG: rhodanese-like domain-containing protein [Clostridia bacterium]|nr:rhodanese-like domain-containing protein [Clostridia bacterium]
MGFFHFFRHADINHRLETYDATPDALLVDVRTPGEYSEGHIPLSRNVPLQQIEDIRHVTACKNTPLFVYCHSGARSGEAASILREMGYTRVENIGGICSYLGRLERGNNTVLSRHTVFRTALQS